MLLAVEGLGKRFGRRWIFRGLSFEFSVGDRVVVLGRNGSGKSTLLKVIAGLLPASEGRFTIAGDTRLSLGYSALEQALYPHQTVIEHLELTANLRGCEARADELLDFVGLDYAKNVQAIELSTGMKARLKMAMAVQARPTVLLLDEPGASLDDQGRALVERIVREQAERGCVLIATNDPNERRLANVELELED
ncbi:heme ABC exporter ATP-binding protein CcmA [soil metagenome]